MKDLIVCVIVLVATVYFLCGIVARNVILGRNPCEMTYSTFSPNSVPSINVPEGLLRDVIMENIFVNSTNSTTAFIEGYMKHILPRNKKYKLLKYSDPRLHNATLNVNPVLFIPGHQGHFNQVRSLASTKHHNKDGFFQYFSLDFDVSHSAYHASDVITQAVYTNMAIRRIFQLYQEKASSSNSQLGKDDFKLIIIGHSMGSIVARTALLLSNHPKCLVSDIIMVSSPNLYSPYTAHGSLDSLFTKVNKAWLQSHYTESKRCMLHRDTDEHLDIADAGASHPHLTINLECPVCPSKTRLISITGGDLDIQVPPHLTRLDPITPVPRNNTIENKKLVSSGRGTGVMQWLFRICYNFVGVFTKSFNAVASLVPGATSNSSDPAVDTRAHSNDTVVDTPSVKEEVSAHNTSKLYAKYEDITMEQWTQYMSKYIDSRHLSLRSSQLVGYPLDHYAILWCRKFLASLTAGMRQIVRENPQNMTALIDIFQLDNVPSAALVQDKPAFIPPIYNYLLLNDTLTSWTETASAEEYQYIVKNSFYKLSSESSSIEYVVNQVFAHALLFHTYYLPRVILFYFIVSILALNTWLFRRLCSIEERMALDDWSVMHPFTHLHLEVLYRGGVNVLTQVIPAEAAKYIFNKTNLMVLIPIVTARLAYDCVYNTAAVGRYSSEACTWLAAYCIAIVVRAAILILIYALRYFAGMFNSLLQLPLLPFKYKFTVKWTAMRILGIAAIWLSCIVYSTSSRFSVLPTMTYVQSVLLLLGISLFYCTILLAIAFPPDSSYNYFQITQLILLYLPITVLAYPSLVVAIDVLYSNSAYDSAVLAPLCSELYGPDQLNHLCIIYVVWWHLWASCFDGYNSVESIKPIVWLVEVFGGENHALFPAISTATSKSQCIHEDGGKYAVFEYIKDADAAVSEKCVAVAKGVTLGPTIRVVSCNCALDKALKKQADWCEWCLCRKCGGKNLPRQHSTDHTYGGEDFNAHFGYYLLLNVLMFSMFYFVKEHFYKYTYVAGTVAVLSLVRDKLAARK